MTVLADLHRKGRIRRGKPNRDPLRKIVRMSHGRELLECGHSQRPRRDFVGITNAVRRRCRQCGAESGFQVCAKRCDECLFTTGKIVNDRRKADMLMGCAQNDSHFICHKFTVEGEGQDVCCRGFFDVNPHATNLMRIAHGLNVVTFVELPTTQTGGAK